MNLQVVALLQACSSHTAAMFRVCMTTMCQVQKKVRASDVRSAFMAALEEGDAACFLLGKVLLQIAVGNQTQASLQLPLKKSGWSHVLGR